MNINDDEVDVIDAQHRYILFRINTEATSSPTNKTCGLPEKNIFNTRTYQSYAINVNTALASECDELIIGLLG